MTKEHLEQLRDLAEGLIIAIDEAQEGVLFNQDNLNRLIAEISKFNQLSTQ